jgi:hypothetical protein
MTLSMGGRVELTEEAWLEPNAEPKFSAGSEHTELCWLPTWVVFSFSGLQ